MLGPKRNLTIKISSKYYTGYNVNTSGAQCKPANVSHAIGVSALPVLRNSIDRSWLADSLNPGTYSSPLFPTRPLIPEITSVYSPRRISLPPRL